MHLDSPTSIIILYLEYGDGTWECTSFLQKIHNQETLATDENDINIT